MSFAVHCLAVPSPRRAITKTLAYLEKALDVLSFDDEAKRKVGVATDDAVSATDPARSPSPATPPTAAPAPSEPASAHRPPPQTLSGDNQTRSADSIHGAPAPAKSPSPAPPAQRIPAPLQFRDPDRYQIVAEHGRGGLGRVYRAHDKELGRDVALKELLEPTFRSEARFLREALITARLEHPGIVPVHEAGRWPDGTPFYAMKLVAGRPLSKIIEKVTTLEARLALLPNLIAVADAIAYAHDRNIIHRDLKPSNVIIGEFGETIVIDWGLAKEIDAKEGDGEPAEGPYRTRAGSDLTVTGSILGTPAYMSPEQGRGDQVDTRSDVYALGAMLYQICTGAVPPADAGAANFRASMRRVQEDLATIVMKSLAPEPAKRYADASALAADLRAFEAGARIAARSYSLPAALKHWIWHHKGLALSIAIPAAIGVMLGSLALRQIFKERDHAADAQHRAEVAQASADQARVAAERDRDRAIWSEASMLLDKDPTKARGLLATREIHGPDDALLMARVLGTPTAKHVITFLPFNTWGAVASEDLETLALSATDKKLRIIDL